MPDTFKIDKMTEILTLMKSDMDHQHMRAHEWQKAADTFRGESLAADKLITDQQRSIISDVSELKRVIKEDVVKWSVILPNSKNWKFYLVLFVAMLGSKIGADFIKLFLSTLLKINL